MLWIAGGIVLGLFALAVVFCLVHVWRQPRCPECQARALWRQSSLKLDTGGGGEFQQAYYECLACEAGFVRYDDEWHPIPRDELPSEWLRQAAELDRLQRERDA
jgi:hypothetical protein